MAGSAWLFSDTRWQPRATVEILLFDSGVSLSYRAAHLTSPPWRVPPTCWPWPTRPFGRPCSLGACMYVTKSYAKALYSFAPAPFPHSRPSLPSAAAPPTRHLNGRPTPGCSHSLARRGANGIAQQALTSPATCLSPPNHSPIPHPSPQLVGRLPAAGIVAGGGRCLLCRQQPAVQGAV